MTKVNRFVYIRRESLTVPKQELAYNPKNTSNRQKLPTYSDSSVDRSERKEMFENTY